ncbi:MAG: AAA family ATPase [Alphaproteobacteria bacterium]|nr:AAA family ATPase [Alphaproteobacteria bacterium]MCB9691093.1 AAA family ATPase [Alphaproteobacteria bacterium]
MLHLFDRRVALVTGKGGVGRTTLSAGLALAAAASGKRVLLTEIGEPDGDYTPLARMFGRDTLPADPVHLRAPKDLDVGDRLHGCVLWPRNGHEAFFRTVIPVGAVVKAAMGSSALHKLLDTAPSFREMGIFYHIFTLLEAKLPDGSDRFDLVIVDMPASGHTLGLTGLPERLLALMPTGPIAEAMHKGRPYFTDPEKCAAWIVTLPEVLPITESEELLDGLRETATPVGGILMNRVLTDPFTEEERAALEPVLTDAHFGHERFVGVVSSTRALDDLEARKRSLDGGRGVEILEIEEMPLQDDALLSAIARRLQEAGGAR